MHYIGQVGPGDRTRAYFDYLSGGQLEWNRMPEAYDRFVYPGIDLSAVSDPEQYERALIRASPTRPQRSAATSRMCAAPRHGRLSASSGRWCLLASLRLSTSSSD